LEIKIKIRIKRGTRRNGVFGSILMDFRLSNKLGKSGEDWMGESVAARNELPPDKPVAS
jgi:hypothetical protein